MASSRRTSRFIDPVTLMGNCDLRSKDLPFLTQYSLEYQIFIHERPANFISRCFRPHVSISRLKELYELWDSVCDFYRLKDQQKSINKFDRGIRWFFASLRYKERDLLTQFIYNLTHTL